MATMPKVKQWPVCSECRTAYVLRLAIFVIRRETGKAAPGPEWLWMRDCKHKKAVPIVNTAYEKQARHAR